MKRVLKIVGLILLAIIALAGLIYLVLPKGPRDPMAFDDPYHQERPMVVAEDYVVAAGTPWATDAAAGILEQGGNAYDAAAAALLMLNVTHGEAASFPSIAPLMIYDAASGQVRSYIGAGTAPQAATAEYFREEGFQSVPDFDIRAQLIPASPDVIVALLRDYGALSFADISAPAIAQAREGFPVHEVMYHNLELSQVERIGFCYLMPANCQAYLQGQWWRPIHYKDRFTLPALADTFEALAQAEQDTLAAGGSREDGLQAVRDYFYQGPLADAILDYHARKGGLITAADLANYSGGWEEPVRGAYVEYTVYTNGTWNQGIVVPMTLQILEGIDLQSMGHNSPEYVHTVIQAIELAQADRDAYTADPAFVDVPLDVLLSPEYAAARRAAMSDHAFPQLPPPGDVSGSGAGDLPVIAASSGEALRHDILENFMVGKDTTQLAIIDPLGNVVVMTPSDFPKSPMIPGTGLTLGDRMTQFRLDPDDVNVMEPGKRPRVTPHAVIIFRNGEFWMGFSTEGGDMQPQALIQVFLNVAVFGMDIQEAIDAPRFRTVSAPSSFAPHEAYPATLYLESTLYDQVYADLQALGYTVERHEDWGLGFGKVGAVLREGESLLAGSDPRGEGTAAGR